MKRIIRFIYNISKLLGFDPLITFTSFRGLPFYIRDFSKLKNQKGQDSTFFFGPRSIILGERFSESGTMSGHYFHQDLFVARKIFNDNPDRHVDVGSRTDGFVAHVAVFRKIEVLDIREQLCKVKNVSFRKADLMKLPEDMTNYCDSISALHSIEHFGLGRYGDPVNYFGYLKALENIAKILKSGGKFYFSVPIGPQRIEFNAHRVFSIKYLITILETDFILKTFSYVDDVGDFHEEVSLTPETIETSYSCKYGCGIFEMIKR
jgi:SAM-dependent methyltransferase